MPIFLTHQFLYLQKCLFKTTKAPMDDYPLTLFHDGDCPICRFDVAHLQARNHEGLLRFIDIASDGFDPGVHGKTMSAFRAEIHAQRPDGSFVTGMEVFRLAYRAVGLGRIVAPTSWAPLRKPADALYRLFARHRPLLSRLLGPMFETLGAWQASRRATACRSGVCATSRDASSTGSGS
jgi:predicted DCC family thiol-disulfide oxidoreductase YuxK